MRRALSMFIVEGIHTSIPLHEQILSDVDFAAGRFDTSFLNKLSLKTSVSAAKSPFSKECKLSRNISVLLVGEFIALPSPAAALRSWNLSCLTGIERTSDGKFERH